ncbi:MAG: hypothetical protein AAGI68_11255 [Planctomycetota bacterium]
MFDDAEMPQEIEQMRATHAVSALRELARLIETGDVRVLDCQWTKGFGWDSHRVNRNLEVRVVDS